MSLQPVQTKGSKTGQKEDSMTQFDTAQATATPAIRPFRVDIPQEATDDLRRRLPSGPPLTGRYRSATVPMFGGRAADH